MMTTLLQMMALTKHYTGQENVVAALDGVSLSLEAGQFVAVRGPSGCGKSTLLLTAGGLLRPDRGEVWLDDTDVYGLSPEERAQFRARHVGFVFQQFHLVPYLSVRDNVLAAAMAAQRSDAADRADVLLERFGMSERRGHVPGRLSTGERQRAALARALMNDPRVILADEPTGNLDEANGDVVLNYLREFAEQGGAVLMVTHDANAAARADHVVTMTAGKILSQVAPPPMPESPAMTTSGVS